MPMPADHELLAIAMEHEQAGRVAEAERIYRQLLAKHPGNADLIHAVGLMAYRSGRAEEARHWIEQAIAIDSGQAIYCNNLGTILQSLEQYAPAAACL